MPPQTPFRVLVFSKTSGYRHASIPAGISAIQALASSSQNTANAFLVTASEDAETCFTPTSLAQYAVIVLLQCIGDFLTTDQIEAFKHFVRAGGGVVAIHGAAAGMLDDEWYGKLIGAHFDSHPDPEPGTVIVEDAEHCIMCGCQGRSGWLDEWYNFRTHPRENKNLKVLMRGDTGTFKGGKMGEDHPLVWWQEFEGGRCFFTALGHFDEAYKDEWFMDQVQRAVLWAARREDSLDQ